MALPRRFFSVILMFIMIPISSFVSSASPSSSSSSSSTCPSQIYPFLHGLKLQCPTTILYSWPIEMDGESFDRVLSSNQANAYVAISFYASWCPFSRNFQSKFAALSSMYPQIKHVKVEQSSVTPIVFSRHGIHSVPSILIVNMTTRVRHHGPKDLPSLLHFYQKATGLEPVINITEDQTLSFEDESNPRSWKSTSFKDLATHEPYLLVSVLFVFMKALLYLYPDLASNAIALWHARIPRLNLTIFGESRQLFTHALHLVDVKRALNKLKLTKSQNFRNGARSARVWASSLASFSLGKTSSARTSHGEDL